MTIGTFVLGAMIVGVCAILVLNRHRLVARMHRLARRKYGQTMGDEFAARVKPGHIIFWSVGIAVLLLLSLVVNTVLHS
jgi:hypothetical protein